MQIHIAGTGIWYPEETINNEEIEVPHLIHMLIILIVLTKTKLRMVN